MPKMYSLLDGLMLVCLALPHFLYAFVWNFPNQWRTAFHKKPVEAFETAAWVLKVAQFGSVAWWYVSSAPSPAFDPSAVHVCQWLAAAALLAGGQALNVGIYRAIGHDGVYYGTKMGRHVPWVTGFPFDVVAHPQYVGSAMTVWGIVTLLMGQHGGAVDGSLLVLGSYWTALYAVTATQEQCT